MKYLKKKSKTALEALLFWGVIAAVMTAPAWYGYIPQGAGYSAVELNEKYNEQHEDSK